MTDVISTLDDYGRPAWLALMIVAFIVAWPIGLAVLAYLLWSGRMGRFSCGGGSAQRRWGEKMKSWGAAAERFDRQYGSSGNHAFDEYRRETLKRLEEEEKEFRDYLDKLRLARDREEFDRFMGERKSGRSGPEASGDTQPTA